MNNSSMDNLIAIPAASNYCEDASNSKMSSVISNIKMGELKQVQEEIERKEIDVNKEVNCRYLLHYASDYGHHHILEYLLDKGANVNVEDEYGITPLLSAIYEGHTKCVELLLAKGAKKTYCTPDGKSYLQAAEKDEIRQLLL